MSMQSVLRNVSFRSKKRSSSRLTKRQIRISVKIGLLLLGVSLVNRSIGDEALAPVEPDLESYKEEIGKKIRLAKKVLPWRLFDSFDEFRGKYVETFGYLEFCNHKSCLFFSKEYAEIPLIEYTTVIPEYRNPFSGYVPRAGDYVRIIARVTEDERWQSVEDEQHLFDDIVLIDEYFPFEQIVSPPRP